MIGVKCRVVLMKQKKKKKKIRKVSNRGKCEIVLKGAK